MKYPHTALLILAAAASLSFAACSQDTPPKVIGPEAHTYQDASIHEAVAVIYPTKGNSCMGLIRFSRESDSVHVRGTVSGLEPSSIHALHIHEFGDQSSPDGMSAGGHFNPEGHPHGGPHDAQHHAGDLGNITAGVTGVAVFDLVLKDVSIAESRDPILGRSVVIHAKSDDLKSQPAGNAGPRIGVGVIGVSANSNGFAFPATSK